MAVVSRGGDMPSAQYPVAITPGCACQRFQCVRWKCDTPAGAGVVVGGWEGCCGNRNLNGYMSDVAIYNYALSATQVSTHYAAASH